MYENGVTWFFSAVPFYSTTGSHLLEISMPSTKNATLLFLVSLNFPNAKTLYLHFNPAFHGSYLVRFQKASTDAVQFIMLSYET